MNDGLYSECYVTPVPGASTAIKRFLMIFACVVGVLAAIIIPHYITMILAAIIIVLVYWRMPMLKTAYEYVFVDGQLDFDKIQGGEKRKNMLRIDFQDLVLVAPSNSHSLDGYRDCQEYNFSANSSEVKDYVIIISKGTKKLRILFSPDEKMLNAMKSKSRSKISEY